MEISTRRVEFMGEPAVLCLTRDITERKMVEEARKRAREKIDAILKSVVDGLVVSDVSGRIILMNQDAEGLLGTTLAATPSRHIDALLTDERVRQQIVATRTLGEEQAPIEWGLEMGKGIGVQILKVRSMPVHTAK